MPPNLPAFKTTALFLCLCILNNFCTYEQELFCQNLRCSDEINITNEEGFSQETSEDNCYSSNPIKVIKWGHVNGNRP